MKALAVVFKIDNGYIVVEEDTHRTVYLKDFNLDSMAVLSVDHEKALRALVEKVRPVYRINARPAPPPDYPEDVRPGSLPGYNDVHRGSRVDDND